MDDDFGNCWEPHDDGYLNNLSWQQELGVCLETYVPTHVRLDLAEAPKTDPGEDQLSVTEDDRFERDTEIDSESGLESIFEDSFEDDSFRSSESDYSSYKDFSQEISEKDSYIDLADFCDQSSEKLSEQGTDEIESEVGELEDLATIDAYEHDPDSNLTISDVTQKIQETFPEASANHAESDDDMSAMEKYMGVTEHHITTAIDHPMPLSLLYVLQGLVETENGLAHNFKSFFEDLTDIAFEEDPPFTWLNVHGRTVARTLAREAVDGLRRRHRLCVNMDYPVIMEEAMHRFAKTSHKPNDAEKLLFSSLAAHDTACSPDEFFTRRVRKLKSLRMTKNITYGVLLASKVGGQQLRRARRHAIMLQ